MLSLNDNQRDAIPVKTAQGAQYLVERLFKIQQLVQC